MNRAAVLTTPTPAPAQRAEGRVATLERVRPTGVDSTEPSLRDGLVSELDPAAQLLTFRLAETCYALPIHGVREIIEYRQPTPVPGAAAWVEGVINLRGTVLPVFDLASRIQQPRQEITRQTCIVVIEGASQDLQGAGLPGNSRDRSRAQTREAQPGADDPGASNPGSTDHPSSPASARAEAGTRGGGVSPGTGSPVAGSQRAGRPHRAAEPVGLIVDSVLSVSDFQDDKMSAPPAFGTPAAVEFLAGVLHQQESLVFVLDAQALLGTDRSRTVTSSEGATE